MKKVIRILVMCVMSLAAFAVVASAEGSQIKPMSYEVYNIRHSRRDYVATVTTAYEASSGARVSISSEASIRVKMNNLTAVFNTKNHGYDTQTGGRAFDYTRLHDPDISENKRVSGVSTRPVYCRYGAEQVISVGIRGSGDILCLNDDGITWGTPRTLRV